MRRGPRKDWVYRGLEYNITSNAALVAQVASYCPLDRNSGFYTLQVATPVGVVLYDCYDYMTESTRVNVGKLGSEARMDSNKKTTIHGVDVDLFLQPTSWTVGNDFVICARIVICEQDLLTGGLALPTNYILLGGGAIAQEPSVYANGWGNLKDAYLREAFATENDMSRFRMRFRWRGRRTLPAHLCLGLYIESGGPALGETSFRLTPRCRTLVS